MSVFQVAYERLVLYKIKQYDDFATITCRSCADPKSFVRECPTLTMFVFMRDGQRIYIELKASHHQPISETPFKWRYASGSMIARQ